MLPDITKMLESRSICVVIMFMLFIKSWALDNGLARTPPMGWVSGDIQILPNLLTTVRMIGMRLVAISQKSSFFKQLDLS